MDTNKEQELIINTLKMLHHIKLIKGDETKIVKPPKDLKATVKLSAEIIDTMRRVIDLPKGTSSDKILQQFLNKTFEK